MKTILPSDLYPAETVHHHVQQPKHTLKDKVALIDATSLDLLSFPAKSAPVHVQQHVVPAPHVAVASAIPTTVATAGLIDMVQMKLASSASTHALTDMDEDPFFVGDLGEVIRQHQRWQRNLPRIEPFFAIKCNPDAMVLKTLAGMGIGFDCASRAEIAAVLDLGVDPSRIIYANPCKQASHIRYAADRGVRMMTFDNAEELHKCKKHHPNAQLVLRILTDDSRSVCRFGTKFGAALGITRGLLALAKELELDVIGVSFHVGSGCFDATAFRDAVIAARKVFDQGLELGYDFQFLDLGGGFPGNCEAQIPFETIAKILGPAVDEMFPPSVRVIAEPGRYFVASAFSLAVNITARRTVVDETKEPHDPARLSYMYYVNDGVYGSFNCILFDHAVVRPRVLSRAGRFLLDDAEAVAQMQHHKCSIWGPTCDSMDNITKDAHLPVLDVGDWMFFDTMGAYTMAAASTFNGFTKSNVLYTNTEEVKP